MCKREMNESDVCKIQAECAPEKRSYSYWVCPECLRSVVSYVEKERESIRL